MSDFREFQKRYNEEVLQHSWGVAVTESSKSQASQEYRQAVQNLINCLNSANAQLKQAHAEYNKMGQIEKNRAPFTKMAAYGMQDKYNRLMQLIQSIKTNTEF